MSDKSAIEWTNATWNPVTGCSKVSPGCAHCYAETISLRFGRSAKPWTPENAAENVVLHPERLDQPLRWKRPRMIFVNSMSDLFHEQVPYEFVREVFNVMRRCDGSVVAATGKANPSHTFQVLTKRPERALELARTRKVGFGLDEWKTKAPNVWLGVSIENARFTWRADVLREIPAAVRFISAEPLLGSLIAGGMGDTQAERVAVYERYGFEAGIHRDLNVNVGRALLDLTGIDWLIVGGESGGRDARPMHPEWARELRDACLHRQATQAPIRERTAFFFKQWGSWTPYEPDAQPPIWNGQDGRQVDGHIFPAGLSEHEPLRSRAFAGANPTWYWPERDAAEGSFEVVYRWAGASPKSGGRLLDGREWNEMPRTRQAVAA